METNPTTELDALDELREEIAAGLENVYLLGNAASFTGGPCPVEVLLDYYTLVEFNGYVTAINDETGKEYTVEW